MKIDEKEKQKNYFPKNEFKAIPVYILTTEVLSKKRGVISLTCSIVGPTRMDRL